MSKEALAKCERLYPRFHAFLKVRLHPLPSEQLIVGVTAGQRVSD